MYATNKVVITTYVTALSLAAFAISLGACVLIGYDIFEGTRRPLTGLRILTGFKMQGMDVASAARTEDHAHLGESTDDRTARLLCYQNSNISNQDFSLEVRCLSLAPFCYRSYSVSYNLVGRN
jgi:hypothetical protein